MGPFGRQALRVIYAAKLLGRDRVTHGFIAEVLQGCGVECSPLQIGSSLGSLSVAHPEALRKHSAPVVQVIHRKGRNHYLTTGERTTGWSATRETLWILEQHPMSKIGGNTGTYRFERNA